MYLVGLHMYYKMIHGPYNIKFIIHLHVLYRCNFIIIIIIAIIISFIVVYVLLLRIPHMCRQFSLKGHFTN